TFKPTAAGSYSGEITVSASGVTPKKVSVSGKCAVITPDPTSYNFGNVAVGKPVTKVITITGTNLTSAMSITLAETEGGQYSINKTTLPASGGTVIVTFKPTDAKSFGASLNISGGSATAVSVCLTGKGVTPTITRNKSTLTFTGSSITSDYVKVTGTNLDDVISLTVTGSTNFTVSPSTISISDAADGKQVKVTCNPKNASSAEATLKISSPYASTKYVTLKYSRGSSGGGTTQICSVEPDGGNEGGNNEFTNGGSLETSLNSTTDVNELAMNSKIFAEGLNIIIESPVEQSAVISDISGRAKSVNLQAGRNEIPVNASGIYIVRIREKTTKLMLK
ncbi:MAG: choice-of-anchor D domain-containing protein, partial [Muribaculaceae bacterium]|nr:choice-of-anchor D domain-containing protein [Muribaculaceae bacterium]